MYSPIEIENVEYQLKPMNCPFHMMIYKSRLRSYRDLPIAGRSSGRSTATSARACCTACCGCAASRRTTRTSSARPDQLEDEILRRARLRRRTCSRTFGFTDYEIYLSTKPEKSSGSDEQWEIATAALRKAARARGLPYEVDAGEGVFYGPKIDVKIKDAIGR